MEAFQKRAVGAVLRRLFGTLLDDYHVDAASLRRVVLTDVRVNADRVNAFLTSAPFRVLHCTVDRLEAHFGGPSNRLSIGTVTLAVAFAGADSSAPAAPAPPSNAPATTADAMLDGVDAVAELLGNFSSTSSVTVHRLQLNLDCVDAVHVHPTWTLILNDVACNLKRGDDAVALSRATALAVIVAGVQVGVALPSAASIASVATHDQHVSVVWLCDVSPSSSTAAVAVAVVVPLNAPAAGAPSPGVPKASSVALAEVFDGPTATHVHACRRAHACAATAPFTAGCVCSIGVVRLMLSAVTLRSMLVTYDCSVAATKARRQRVKATPKASAPAPDATPLIVAPTSAKARLKSAWTSMKRAAKAFMRGDASTHTVMMQSHIGQAEDMSASMRVPHRDEGDLGASVMRAPPVSGGSSLRESMFVSAHSHSAPAAVSIDDDAFHAHLSGETVADVSDAPRMPIRVQVACVAVSVVDASSLLHNASLTDACTTLPRLQVELHGAVVHVAATMTASASNASVAVWHAAPDASLVPSRLCSITGVCVAMAGAAPVAVEVGVDAAFLCVNEATVSHCVAHVRSLMDVMNSSVQKQGAAARRAKGVSPRVHACVKSCTISAPQLAITVSDITADVQPHGALLGSVDVVAAPAGARVTLQSADAAISLALETACLLVDERQVVVITPAAAASHPAADGVRLDADLLASVGDVHVALDHAIYTSLSHIYTHSLPAILVPLVTYAANGQSDAATAVEAVPAPAREVHIHGLTVSHRWPTGGLQLLLQRACVSQRAAGVGVTVGAVEVQHVDSDGGSRTLLHVREDDVTRGGSDVIRVVHEPSTAALHVTCVRLELHALAIADAASHALQSGPQALLVTLPVPAGTSEAESTTPAATLALHVVVDACCVVMTDQCSIELNAASVRLLSDTLDRQGVSVDVDATARLAESSLQMCARIRVDAGDDTESCETDFTAQQQCDHTTEWGSAASRTAIVVTQADAFVSVADLRHATNVQNAVVSAVMRLQNSYAARAPQESAAAVHDSRNSIVDMAAIQSRLRAAISTRVASQAYVVQVGGDVNDAALALEDEHHSTAVCKPPLRPIVLSSSVFVQLQHACIAVAVSSEHVLSLGIDGLRLQHHVHSAASGPCPPARAACMHSITDDDDAHAHAWSPLTCTHLCAADVALRDGDRRTGVTAQLDDVPVLHIPHACINAHSMRAVVSDYTVCLADVDETDVHACLPSLTIRAHGDHVRALDALSRLYEQSAPAAISDPEEVGQPEVSGAGAAAGTSLFLRRVTLCPCTLDLEFNPRDVAATVTLPGVAHTVARRLGLPSATVTISLLPIVALSTLPRVALHACDAQAAFSALAAELGQHLYTDALPVALHGMTTIAAAQLVTHVASSRIGGRVMDAALSVLPEGSLQRLAAARDGVYVYVCVLVHALWTAVWGRARVSIQPQAAQAEVPLQPAAPVGADSAAAAARVVARHDEDWIVL